MALLEHPFLDFVLDDETRRVTRAGLGSVQLTRQQARLLELFIEQAPRSMTEGDLLMLWSDEIPEEDAVHQAVSSLRGQLERIGIAVTRSGKREYVLENTAETFIRWTDPGRAASGVVPRLTPQVRAFFEAGRRYERAQLELHWAASR